MDTTLRDGEQKEFFCRKLTIAQLLLEELQLIESKLPRTWVKGNFKE
jgi:isopropylmalate/homocitrate/citramalate synthase